MAYALEKLNAVRALREQLAQSDLARGRQRLHQADEELARRQMDLECQCSLQSKMKASLFDEIDRKEVTLNDLKCYLGRISDLRTEEDNCREKVRQAVIQKDFAREDADRLCAQYQLRYKENVKLKTFRDAWMAKVEEEKRWWADEENEEMVMNRFYFKDSNR